MREHCSLTNFQGAGHLAFDCCHCDCRPLFDNVIVIGRGNTKRQGETIEAFHVSEPVGGKCVSVPSISLSDKNIAFIKGRAVNVRGMRWGKFGLTSFFFCTFR